ncbi:MAG: 3-hydroxyacyl-ACP dehydratase [Vibrio sp.]
MSTTTMRKPTVIQHEMVSNDQKEKCATLLLEVHQDIEDFKGHFPEFSLLPGVTQVDWAVFYAKQYLNTPSEFKGMEVLKFQQPILKNSQVELQLTWNEEKQKLHFIYKSKPTEQDLEAAVHASGRILLG